MPKTGRGPMSSRNVSTTYSSAAGSPGPLARKTASGAFATTSAALAVHGCSSTVAPRTTRLRTIEDLMPVSIAAMRMSPSPSPTSTVSAGVTSRARSRPVIGGSASISARASRSLTRSGKTPPRIAPALRMWRTRARVSTPVIARPPQSVHPVEPAALGAGGVVGVRRGAHDRRPRPDAVGLHRLGARPVVADVRVGERDELAGEGGVGHRLLVAAHPGREDDLAGGVGVRAARVAVEAGAVLE